MPAIESINTVAGALAAGFATSLHCAGMCGPLACGLATLKKDGGSVHDAAALYHAGRLVSYAAFGAAAGVLGQRVVHGLGGGHWLLLPWVLTILLLLTALGVAPKFPKPKWLKMWSARTRLKLVRVPARFGALGLGLATPLLPCGPLYLMFGAAMLSGSPWRGAEFMLAFCLGTIPLLWLAQHHFRLWQMKLTPARLMLVRRCAALLAALFIVLRIWPATAALAAEGRPADTPATCPMCGPQNS